MTALRSYFSRRSARLELWRYFETPHCTVWVWEKS